MQEICGFLVVRKPYCATNERLKPNLQIGEKIYHGVDRLRWQDLDDLYYQGSLFPNLLPIWRDLDRDSNDLSGLSLLRDYQTARRVFELSKDKSDIIAIWSPELAELKGTMQCGVGLRYLGIDCFCLGEWSILLSGVFERPDLFSKTVAQLNGNGLLQNERECLDVQETYARLAASELVEPLAATGRMTCLRVFDVIVDKD